MIYEELYIDISKLNSGYSVIARRNEQVAQLKVIVTNDGTEINNSIYTCNFIGNNPRGDLTSGTASRISSEDGAYLYTFSKENLSVIGNYKTAYFELFDSGGKKITSTNFKLRVIDEADMSADQATVHVTLLDELLEKHDINLTNQKKEFEDYADSQKDDWQDFVSSNKETIEGIDPGGKVLSELIDARKPEGQQSYPTLGERLNDLTTILETTRKGDKQAVFKSLEGGIYPYLLDFYQLHSKEIVSDNTLKFNLINDAHAQRSLYPPPATDHGESATRIYQYLLMHGLFSKHVDFSIANGDQIHGREPIDVCRQRNQHFKEICDYYETPVFYNLGNHEDGNCYKTPKTATNMIPKSELLDIYGINSFNHTVVSEKHKLKVLIVSVYDNPEKFVDGINIYPRDKYSVITNETFDFVKSELQSTPDDYFVLAVMHNVISSNDSAQNINHAALTKLFSSFQMSQSQTITSNVADYPINSSVSFVGKPQGRFIGIIGGHRHKDEYVQTRGWHDITRTCQICSDSSDVTEKIRILDTPTELVTDIVNIDTVKRKMKIQRFGFGESLEMTF